MAWNRNPAPSVCLFSQPVSTPALSLGLNPRVLLSRMAPLAALLAFIMSSVSQPYLLAGVLGDFWEIYSESWRAVLNRQCTHLLG